MSDRLAEQLAARLARPLPGPMVGTAYEPRPTLGRRYDLPPADARQAAVLILLYPRGGGDVADGDAADWHVPLTLRPGHLPDHAGQISLPGGQIEPGESAAAAAVREFHEELGAADATIEVLGRLSTIYVAASHFRVEPFVAVTRAPPAWSPNPVEVEALLEVPLAHLLAPETLGCHARHYQGQEYTAPHFGWGGQRIWGATCMILGEFVTVVREALADG